MRMVSLVALFFLLTVWTGAGLDSAAWLDIASDPTVDARERNFAAEQVIMLADSSASILIAALRGEDSDRGLRRQVAARIMGEIGAARFEAPLLEAAFGDDYFRAEAAKSALARIYSRFSDEELSDLLASGVRRPHAAYGGIAPANEDWLALTLRHGRTQGQLRALVMAGLERKYTASGTAIQGRLASQVTEGLRDPENAVRLQAVRLMPQVAGVDAPEKLAALLYTETDVRLLRSALQAMAVLRPPEYGEAVERHASHADPTVAIEALAALAAMGYPGALFPGSAGNRAVATFVNHPSTPVRRRALEILAESKSPAALEYLETGLYDRVAANRALAARALGDMGFASPVGALSPLRKDPQPNVRSEAAIALAKLGVVGVTAGVVDDLESGPLPRRIAAAATLGRLGDARAVPALVRAAGSNDAALAYSAILSLGELGDTSCGTSLLALLRTTESPVLAAQLRTTLFRLFGDAPGQTAAETENWARSHGIEPGVLPK